MCKFLVVDESKEKHEHALPKETEVAHFSTAVKRCEEQGCLLPMYVQGEIYMVNEDSSKRLLIKKL